MATHSSILAQRIPTRSLVVSLVGSVHRVAKGWTGLKRLSMRTLWYYVNMGD